MSENKPTDVKEKSRFDELLKKDIETCFEFLDKCRYGSYRIKQDYFWALKNVIITLDKVVLGDDKK